MTMKQPSLHTDVYEPFLHPVASQASLSFSLTRKITGASESGKETLRTESHTAIRFLWDVK